MELMTEDRKPRQRARRSDAGTVRVTERDMQVFSWLLGMKAIYESDLCVLIGRWEDKPPIGEPAARALVRRWARAEDAAGNARPPLADAFKLIVNRPRIIRLLPGGAALLGDEHFRVPSETTIYHQAEVARVRLWLEGRPAKEHGQMVRWESERDFRQHTADMFGNPKTRVHTPDGVATYEDGTKVAVEVERAPKSFERLTTIIERVASVYPEVLYFVATPEIRRTVTAAEAATRKKLKDQGVTRMGRVTVIDQPTEVN